MTKTFMKLYSATFDNLCKTIKEINNYASDNNFEILSTQVLNHNGHIVGVNVLFQKNPIKQD
jgi:hypothetical protein